jgi:hypothetical protein
VVVHGLKLEIGCHIRLNNISSLHLEQINGSFPKLVIIRSLQVNDFESLVMNSIVIWTKGLQLWRIFIDIDLLRRA